MKIITKNGTTFERILIFILLAYALGKEAITNVMP